MGKDVPAERNLNPQEALKNYLDQFKAARDRWERPTKNESRWFPRLDKKIAKLTDEKLKHHRESGLPLKPEEMTVLIQQSPEYKLMERISKLRKEAEAEIREAVNGMRPLLIELSRDGKETEANLTVFDQLAPHPVLNSNEIIALVKKLTGSPSADASTEAVTRRKRHSPKQSAEDDAREATKLVVGKIYWEEFKKEGRRHIHKRVCDRLASSDRPPGVKWNNLRDPWPRALKLSPGPVRTWISKAAKDAKHLVT